MSESKWYLRTQNDTFGPEPESKLIEWAKLGRIQPGQEVSDDNITWHRVEDVAFLDMRFSIDIGDGNPRGPFNRADVCRRPRRSSRSANRSPRKNPLLPKNLFRRRPLLLRTRPRPSRRRSSGKR